MGVGILSSVVEPSPVVTDNFKVPPSTFAASAVLSAVVSSDFAAVVSLLPESHPTKRADNQRCCQ